MNKTITAISFRKTHLSNLEVQNLRFYQFNQRNHVNQLNQTKILGNRSKTSICSHLYKMVTNKMENQQGGVIKAQIEKL